MGVFVWFRGKISVDGWCCEVVGSCEAHRVVRCGFLLLRNLIKTCNVCLSVCACLNFCRFSACYTYLLACFELWTKTHMGDGSFTVVDLQLWNMLSPSLHFAVSMHVCGLRLRHLVTSLILLSAVY